MPNNKLSPIDLLPPEMIYFLLLELDTHQKISSTKLICQLFICQLFNALASVAEQQLKTREYYTVGEAIPIVDNCNPDHSKKTEIRQQLTKLETYTNARPTGNSLLLFASSDAAFDYANANATTSAHYELYLPAVFKVQVSSIAPIVLDKQFQGWVFPGRQHAFLKFLRERLLNIPYAECDRRNAVIMGAYHPTQTGLIKFYEFSTPELESTATEQITATPAAP